MHYLSTIKMTLFRKLKPWCCGSPPLIIFFIAAIQTVIFLLQVNYLTWKVQNHMEETSKMSLPKLSYLPPVLYPIPTDFVFKSSNFTQCRYKTRVAFWECLQPSLKCPLGSLQRVGRNGDGGKWTCGLDYFGSLTRRENATPCNVYSFGVNEESSFEDAILKFTNCQVFAYDPSVSRIGPPITSDEPRVHFEKKGIDGINWQERRTLATFMQQNGGHRWIDILKIDVEASEYATLENILETFDELPFGQLLIEFHEFLDIYPNSTSWVVSLMERLQDRGLRLFHTEKNFIYTDAAEFSFLNVKSIGWFLSKGIFKDYFLRNKQ